MKKVNTKKCTLVKPWITKALLKSIRKKNTLYKCFLNNPTPQRENLYKCYKNRLNHTLRLAKRLYYGKNIEEAKSNIKSTWRILNEVLNNKSKKQNLPSLFRSGNEELSDPIKIAEQFCNYFSNIGPNLASNIPASEKPYRSYLYGNLCSLKR